MNGLLLSLLPMLPMVGLTLFWQKHPRGRARGIAEAFGAILLAVLIGFVVGPLIPDSDGPATTFMLPMILGSIVMSMALNRMVRSED